MGPDEGPDESRLMRPPSMRKPSHKGGPDEPDESFRLNLLLSKIFCQHFVRKARIA